MTTHPKERGRGPSADVVVPHSEHGQRRRARNRLSVANMETSNKSSMPDPLIEERGVSHRKRASAQKVRTLVKPCCEPARRRTGKDAERGRERERGLRLDEPFASLSRTSQRERERERERGLRLDARALEPFGAQGQVGSLETGVFSLPLRSEGGESAINVGPSKLGLTRDKRSTFPTPNGRHTGSDRRERTRAVLAYAPRVIVLSEGVPFPKI